MLRYRTLFATAFSAAFQLMLAFFNSSSVDLLQVFAGLPTFLLPCGFHFKACLVSHKKILVCQVRKDPTTDRSHFNVKPVTSVLFTQRICESMNKDSILERSLLNVKPVASVLPHHGNCECMKDPILALSHISAKPVKSVLAQQDICGPMNDTILERSLLNVKPVTNVLPLQGNYGCMKDPILA
ncbi:hypothetical protein ACROYT_G024607 [Oculina patagonica]